MKLQNGFAPLGIILIAAAIATTFIGGYKTISRIKGYNVGENKITQIPSFIQEEFPIPTSSSDPITPTPSITTTTRTTVISQPTKKPASSKGTINAYLTVDNQPNNDGIFEFIFRNETTGQEEKVSNKTSNLLKSNLSPGRYNITITFPVDRFVYSSQTCQGCDPNNKGFYDWGSKCGYEVILKEGDNISFVCNLKSTHRISLPNPNNGSNQPSGTDDSPPTTNLYYPQPNGSITYKIDGKVCAIMTEPSDNFGSQNVETFYAFDGGSFQKGIGYLCAESLPNGPHTLSYYSKDKAGNVESTKTIQFTVNISGN